MEPEIVYIYVDRPIRKSRKLSYMEGRRQAPKNPTTSTVKCAICGVERLVLWEHLKKVHGLSKAEYVDLYKQPAEVPEVLERLRATSRDSKVRAGRSERAKKLFSTDAAREEASKRSKKMWEDPDTRASISNSTRERWKDPEYRRKCSQNSGKNFLKYTKSERNRVASSNRMKALFEDPEFRKRHSERQSKLLTERFKDPEARRIQGERSRAYHHRLWKENPQEMLRRLSTHSRYKRYQYKTHTMRSSWEVEFAQWMDAQGIQWEYEPKTFTFIHPNTGRDLRYTPDFWVESWDCFVEVKAQWAACNPVVRYKALMLKKQCGFDLHFVMEDALDIYRKELQETT